MNWFKAWLTFAVLAVACACLADTAYIQLSTYPTIAVADARSRVNVSAVVRDSNGRPVPDGSQVIFDSTLGTFQEQVVRTSSGIAHGTLVAGGIPGSAIITAKCLSFNAVATLQFDFVSNPDLLKTAQEYVEVVAPTLLKFSFDQHLVGVAGANRGAHIRYRDITIDADDAQLDIPTYEVRARHARVTIGKSEHDYDEVYLVLNKHTGFGTTTYMGTRVVDDDPYRPFDLYVRANVVPSERYGLVAISANGIAGTTATVPPNLFQFQDLTDTSSFVYAKKAVIFPHREIQFHKAEIYVNDVKVVTLPLFEVNLQQAGQLITDPILNVNNSQLEVNYPHYLSLRPGETSLLRFRTGQSYGRDFGGSHGVFLDYELNWNRGDDMDGGLVFSGIARKDWTLGVHQYYRFDERTNAFAQVDMPAGQSIFGSVGANRQFDGFQSSLNGSGNQSIRGPKFDTQQFSFVTETNPIKMGTLPANIFYGVTANDNVGSTDFGQDSQENAGLRVRAQSLPLRIDKTTTANLSFSVAKLQGTHTPKGLSMIGEAVASRTFNHSASVILTYDFNDDGFNSALLGQHQFSARINYAAGNFSTSLFGSKSADIRQMSAYGDVSYRLSNVWRLASNFTYDRYLTEQLTDYYMMIAYRIGIREFGLTWSRLTKRFGIQVLGASFN